MTKLIAYDAGLLNDFGGGNVEWWWDYIRVELECARVHYAGEAADQLAAKDTEIARLRDALERVMIGGNHLALLIGADHPPYTAEPFDALEHYGSCDAYEAWCAWRSIMQARAELSQETE